MKNTVLVVGASGIVGGAHVRRLSTASGVRVLAASRRPLEAGGSVVALPLDLTVADPGAEHAHALGEATHLVYAAFADGPGAEAQRGPNVALLQATLDLVERRCPALRHATLIQGMKAYGSHLGPFETPAREGDPRPPGGHFYFDQQDVLAARAAALGWGWTALRPHFVVGPARRSPQNLIAFIAIYAALMRAQGRPLSFPGPQSAFDAVSQATDADLLSRAIDWAGETPAASGRVFNLTNGDFFRWRRVWPRLAEALGMEAAGPDPRSLAEEMVDAGPVWSELVRRHGLEPNRLEDLVSWPFADYAFGIGWDVMADTLACRRAGFLEFVDSEAMLVDRLAEMRRLRIAP